MVVPIVWDVGTDLLVPRTVIAPAAIVMGCLNARCPHATTVTRMAKRLMWIVVAQHVMDVLAV